MTQHDYERFRDFVAERMGLDFTEDKRRMLNRGLAETAQLAGCSNLDELYTLLKGSSNTSSVWDSLVSSLTVGETYFFRNTNHFDALAQHILPALLAEREHSSRRIRIWSAGCATGEEPYSIAILLHELIPNLESWNIVILATDINRDALHKAQEGVYGAWSFRGVDKRVQDTYFGLNDKRQYTIADKIKRMVTFDCLNLVCDPYPSLANNTNAMDVILCRNVTIYFNAQITQNVVSNFRNCLTDGGYLIPGASEPNMLYYEDFQSQNYPGAVIYRKQGAPKAKKPSLLFTLQPAATPAQPMAGFSPTLIPPKPAEWPFKATPSTPPPAAPSFLPAAQPPSIEPPAPAPAKKTPAPEKETPPVDLYQAALQLLKDGHADAALLKLYEKIDREANFAPAYYTLGKIYANKGNLEEAQNWCQRAIKIDKLHPEPYYTLSMIYQQNGLIEMAQDALKKTIYLDRGFVLAHYNLAQLYRRQGEKDLAVKSLQNVQQLLASRSREESLPEGDGLVVGRLLELVEIELAAGK